MPPSLVTAAWATWSAVNLRPLPGAVPTTMPQSVVKLGIRVPETARTAESLGAEREGTGIVISADGLILTIGYLILEAASILIVTHDGRVFPAQVAGFDHATGFGLLRVSQPLGCRPVTFGDTRELRELHGVTVAGHDAAGGVTRACVVARRPFTGWWEYALESALFTAPARGNHSGAALLDDHGRLVGVGSLWVSDALEAGAAFPGNMFVPIDLLTPILDDLVTLGRRRGPARPWLGLYSEEVRSHVVVTQVLHDSPAARAGVKRGDVILGVGQQAIGDQHEFYRTVWASGEAGVELSLKVLRDKAVREVMVRSADRLEYLQPWAATFS
jgi:S1-C subfamily serine protease